MLWCAGHATWNLLGSKLNAPLTLLFFLGLAAPTPPSSPRPSPPYCLPVGFLLASTCNLSPLQTSSPVSQMSHLTASQLQFQEPKECQFLPYVCGLAEVYICIFYLILLFCLLIFSFGHKKGVDGVGEFFPKPMSVKFCYIWEPSGVGEGS